MPTELVDAKSQWQRVRKDMPEITFSDTAQMIGPGGQGLALRLLDDWPALLSQMPRLGRVVCRTCNDAATHHRRGVFQQIEVHGDIGVVLGEEIDLRLFMRSWHSGFAVIEETRLQAGFQFFDRHGQPILKVDLQPESDWEAYRQIVNQFQSADQTQPLILSPKPGLDEIPDAEIDAEGFHRAWLQLEDTVYFADVLKRFRVSRSQGLRLAPPGYARRVSRDATRQILQGAMQSGLRIMIFVRSPGCLQISTGKVHGLNAADPEKIEVMDTDLTFRLHLSRVVSSWIVRKPTAEGIITSLELFNPEGDNVALFFGKRGYGMSENRTWRSLLDAIR